jgi:hypothetical protein
VGGERRIVDGDPSVRLVKYPLAGHDPELAADRFAVILARGRVGIVGQSLGIGDGYRVDRDQGSGRRGEGRVAPRPGQPQVPFGVKAGHIVTLLPRAGPAPSCAPGRTRP